MTDDQMWRGVATAVSGVLMSALFDKLKTRLARKRQETGRIAIGIWRIRPPKAEIRYSHHQPSSLRTARVSNAPDSRITFISASFFLVNSLFHSIDQGS